MTPEEKAKCAIYIRTYQDKIRAAEFELMKKECELQAEWVKVGDDINLDGLSRLEICFYHNYTAKLKEVMDHEDPKERSYMVRGFTDITFLMELKYKENLRLPIKPILPKCKPYRQVPVSWIIYSNIPTWGTDANWHCLFEV